MVRKARLLIFLLISFPALAADITVNTDRNPVALDETFRIIFTVSGSQDGEPDFSPLNKDFQLLGTSQSSSFSMVNGRTSSSKTYTLTVAANQKGKLTIPPIHFGKDKSPAWQITITDSGQSAQTPVQQPNATTVPGDLLFITTEVDSKNPYVQQQVILTLKIYRRVEWASPALSSPEFDGIEAAVQSLGKEKNYESTYKGSRYAVTELRYAIFPQQSGKLTIKPFQLNARIPSSQPRKRSRFSDPFSDDFFDDFFSSRRQNYTTKTARGKPVTLDVKPVPADFKGDQWLPAKDIKLRETWSGDIQQLKTGEPVTRTIALIADGLGVSQLPAITFDDLNGLKHYPDQPVNNEQATDRGLLSTHTQKVALIPSLGGQFKTPAIEIPWWNTKTDKMEIARIPAQTLVATGIAPAATTTSPGAGIAPDAGPANTDSRTNPQPSASSPEKDVIAHQWLWIASGLLLLLWLGTTIAWLNARKTTPTARHDDRETDLHLSYQQALKTLKQACQTKQPEKVRDALILWGKVNWQHQAPNSLEEIASRVSAELANEIHRLSRSLYSPDQSSWDADKIYLQVKTMAATASDRKNVQESDLEPLYR